MSRKSKHFTQLPGYVKATHAMITKAKHSLGIPSSVKLPRCIGKNAKWVQMQEKAGNFEHSDKAHICPECRCKARAGWGTHHLGMGLCIIHENAKEYKLKAKKINEAHKIAIRSGFPDRGYTYAAADPDGYVARIRESAAEAKGMMDLREELNMIQVEIQKVMDSYNTAGKFMRRVKQVTGSGKDRDEKFILVEADDMEKCKTLNMLMNTLGKMSVQNLKLTEEDVVTHGQVKVWAEAVVNIAQEMAPDKAWESEFIEKFAKALNSVHTGRSPKKKRAK